ncbi:MAG: transglutaminase domain-containing protein [Terriglobus roseus]|nr:transglutaminase domain-containing protein [Terriglobus roseus]
MNQSTETPPPVPSSRPGAGGAGSPPPVPLGSRPDLAALQASKPKMNGAANGVANGPSGAGCLICRDFSGPDNHAARFPRESIPSQDLNWLSHELTAPFPSPTDKARAIFTWLHHNIKYDTAGFFSGNKGPQTPAGVMQSGLAVCAGYGALFSAMALPAVSSIHFCPSLFTDSYDVSRASRR